MRPTSWLVPCVALAAVLACRSARADGAFLTIKESNGATVGMRVALATFTAGTQPSASTGHGETGAGGAAYTPTTFEIDSTTNATEYAAVLATGKEVTVVVEFTTGSGQDAEQVTSVATFTHALLGSWGLTYDASGLRVAYALVAQEVKYTTPPAPASLRSRVVAPLAVRALATPLPVLRRPPVGRIAAALGPGAPPPVDAAFLSFTGPGAPPRNQIKTASLGIQAPVNLSRSSGAGTGKLSMSPLSVTATHGFTPQLQQAAASGAVLQGATLSFVHAGPGGAQTPVLDVALERVLVKSDQVSLAGGVTTESTTLACEREKLIDDATQAAALVP